MSRLTMQTLLDRMGISFLPRESIVMSPSVQPYVFYRQSLLEGTVELDVISELFPKSHNSSADNIPMGSVVFPRFNSIPFGQELEQAVSLAGSSLVNSWEQYLYVSHLFDWVKDLGDLTPPAYRVADILKLPEGEYFVKGELNSDKHDWNGSAYAPTVASVHDVVQRLHSHSVISHQDLVIRPFVHYRKLGVMKSGQPLINEWRVFVLDGKVMAYGFYWSKQMHLLTDGNIDMLDDSNFFAAIDTALARVGDKMNFMAIDLAEKPDGNWDVIELNDGNMSGLCGVNPVELWSNIKKHYTS